ncbi:hypothetical protein [Polyangium jinanense]|uniref:Lipoprotein n=1 Tax=Polyangium jinanense TaxID=2829994 RepID=A0A9X3XCK3_9BACT|nr:hypothetical protein [Polyangium jinanense]MDC3959990.1 hypothetical protein [Polyangium jinanense]MDC3986208.1 hypothetical protein [Polyangium jinanense]
MKLSIKTLSGCFLLSLVIAACSGAGSSGSGDGDGGSDPGSGGNGAGGSGNGGSSSGGGSGDFKCCLNDTNYRCPNKAAFDKCVGFDIDGCINACSPEDFGCIDNCFMQAENATNDPSSCMEDPSAQCGSGSSSGGGACVGEPTGQSCKDDTDCNTQNCTNGCCQGTDAGSPCKDDTDCSSQNCTGGTCQ